MPREDSHDPMPGLRQSGTTHEKNLPTLRSPVKTNAPPLFVPALTALCHASST